MSPRAFKRLPNAPQGRVGTRRARSVGLVSCALLACLLPFGCGDGSGGASETTAQSGTSGLDAASTPLDDERLDVGIKLLAEGRLVEAGMIFDTVAGEHPEMARANFYKGLVLHQKQSHASALSWYEAAAASDQAFKERDTLPYYLGWCYYYAGKPDDARARIDAYLRTDDERSDAHFLSGIIFLDAGELEPAQQALARAIELADDDQESQRSMARAWIRLADVHSQQMDFEAAITSVDRAIELRPDLSQAWFRRYTILMRMGDDAEAAIARKRWKELSSFEGENLEPTP